MVIVSQSTVLRLFSFLPVSTTKMWNFQVKTFIVFVIIASHLHAAHVPKNEEKQSKTNACSSYMAGINDMFVPIATAISDDVSLFMAGKDKGGENMYFCKLNYDGRELFGRGRSDMKCFVPDGKYEVTFRSGYKVLIKPPKTIKLSWKKVPDLEKVTKWSEAEKMLHSVNAVSLGISTQGNSKFAGMCEDDPDTLQEPEIRYKVWTSPPFPTSPPPILERKKRWTINEELQREKTIPGFLNTKNSTSLKITWGGDVLFCNNFTVLTCEERAQKKRDRE